jgi:predicted regulator of Ras-like GTPase activity (Roadblock/LC7/MglB family)
MANTVATSKSSKREAKGDLLNQVVKDLMVGCDSILAVIIADWQGLSFASKLPQAINEDEISATTLFTLEGAEGTRKELEKSLLGNKLSYLIMVTERNNKPAYMVIFPIENLGYIAVVSHTREDMGVIIQNMKAAVQKAAEILSDVDKNPMITQENLEQLITPKYDKLMEKLDKLKKVKINFFDGEEQRMVTPSSPAPPIETPSTIEDSVIELPPVGGPPLPPAAPFEFIEIETEIDEGEPDILPGMHLSKFQVEFVDFKNTRYIVIIEALNEFDVEVKLKERKEFQNIKILKIVKME